MVGGAKSHLEWRVIGARDAQRAQTNLVPTRTQRPYRDWNRIVFECLQWRYGSAVACHRDRGSRFNRLVYGISPLEADPINPTIELPEFTQSWGNRLSESTNRTLCTQGPRRKEQWPHKRLAQTCPWVSRSLWWRCGSVVVCCRVGGTECSSACMGPFEGGRHYLHYLHHSLASGKQQWGNTVPPFNRKLD